MSFLGLDPDQLEDAASKITQIYQSLAENVEVVASTVARVDSGELAEAVSAQVESVGGNVQALTEYLVMKAEQMRSAADGGWDCTPWPEPIERIDDVLLPVPDPPWEDDGPFDELDDPLIKILVESALPPIVDEILVPEPEPPILERIPFPIPPFPEPEPPIWDDLPPFPIPPLPEPEPPIWDDLPPFPIPPFPDPEPPIWDEIPFPIPPFPDPEPPIWDEIPFPIPPFPVPEPTPPIFDEHWPIPEPPIWDFPDLPREPPILEFPDLPADPPIIWD